MLGGLEVKGTAFVARRSQIERAFGIATFEKLVREQALVDMVFHSPVLATSRLPMDAFLRLNDRIVKQLYGGDEKSYWETGTQSADFALGPSGPYNALVKNRDVKSLVESGSRVWKTYFDEGSASSTYDGSSLVTLTLTTPIRHVYFEYAVCGFWARGLQLVSGKAVKHRVVRGFSRGDRDVLYEFKIG
jgi:hypothetical protein